MQETTVSAQDSFPSSELLHHLSAACLYLLITLLLMYPASLQMGEQFIGGERDLYQNVWNFRWVRHVMFGPPESFFISDYLYYPYGVVLYLHTLSLANSVPGALLSTFLSWPLSYNLVLLCGFVLSGWAMYWLAGELTGHRPAAFLAGMVFTFSPYHFGHGLSHINLVALQWLPLFVLFLIKTRRRESLTYPVWGAFFLILTALGSWYYFVFALVLMAFYLLWEHIREPGECLSDFVAGRYLLLLALAFFALLPLVAPMVSMALNNTFFGQHPPTKFAADAASFICPSELLTLGKRMGTDTCWNGFPHVVESGTYLGLTVLVLSLWAVVTVPESRFWGGVGLFALLLAMGPSPTIMGQALPLPTLYDVFEALLPFTSFMGVAVRWISLVMFCLAILSAYGLRDIAGRFSGANVPLLLFVAVAAVVLLEFSPVPYPTMTADVPDFYTDIQDESPGYGILDETLGRRRLYYAAVHRKPIVGGGISRIPERLLDAMNRNRVLRDLMFQSTRLGPEDRPLAREILRDFRIKYVVVSAENTGKARLLRDDFGFPVVYQDDTIRVFLTY